jgi:micrococcal nuclease
MRTLLSVVCAATLVAASVSAQNARPTDLVGRTFQAHVVGVIDGDTMEVVRVNTKRHIRIRLDAIDAPETGEPFSEEARSMARVTVFDKIVEIVGKDVDRYGRLVARIQTNGKDLSTEIVSAGLACHFLRHSSDATLTLAEKRARSLGLGFWAAGSPKPRCAALNSATGLAPLSQGFFGNVSSRVYHSSTCKNARCKNCTQEFSSSAAAEAAGYRPARDCVK